MKKALALTDTIAFLEQYLSGCDIPIEIEKLPYKLNKNGAFLDSNKATQQYLIGLESDVASIRKRLVDRVSSGTLSGKGLKSHRQYLAKKMLDMHNYVRTFL